MINRIKELDIKHVPGVEAECVVDVSKNPYQRGHES